MNNIKFEINDAPRDSLMLDLPGTTTIRQIKERIIKEEGNNHLTPGDFMLLIEGVDQPEDQLLKDTNFDDDEEKSLVMVRVKKNAGNNEGRQKVPNANEPFGMGMMNGGFQGMGGMGNFGGMHGMGGFEGMLGGMMGGRNFMGSGNPVKMSSQNSGPPKNEFQPEKPRVLIEDKPTVFKYQKELDQMKDLFPEFEESTMKLRLEDAEGNIEAAIDLLGL